jgi:NitT/TauT family transport system permease protein
MLLIFGLGVSAKIAFGVIHGVFPIAIFTMNAVRNVAPVYHRTARVLRLTPLGAAVTIMAPAALPEILAGIRVGVALTLLGVLIGELFAATAGLGFALRRAMDVNAVTDIMAIALVLFCFAAGANALLRIVERRARHAG